MNPRISPVTAQRQYGFFVTGILGPISAAELVVQLAGAGQYSTGR
jgi:hypothetical protein